jgi:hypothetical protein
MANLESLLDEHFCQNGRPIPGRIQAAIALLERLRESPSLELSHHKKAGSSGIYSHETYGERAHARMNLRPINKIHGRRSCDVGNWGQVLLDLLAVDGFASMPPERQGEFLTGLQDGLGSVLKSLLSEEPLRIRAKGRSAEAAIRDALTQAEIKAKAGDVAQYLIGTTLEMMLACDLVIVGSNKGDRNSRFDPAPRLGDFEIDDTVLEVAMGMPDEKHVTQVADALDISDKEVWVLTHPERTSFWKVELSRYDGVDMKRVVVMSVDGFVGQYISCQCRFDTVSKLQCLKQLIDRYNERWVSKVGTPGIRISLD